MTFPHRGANSFLKVLTLIFFATGWVSAQTQWVKLNVKDFQSPVEWCSLNNGQTNSFFFLPIGAKTHLFSWACDPSGSTGPSSWTYISYDDMQTFRLVYLAPGRVAESHSVRPINSKESIITFYEGRSTGFTNDTFQHRKFVPISNYKSSSPAFTKRFVYSFGNYPDYQSSHQKRWLTKCDTNGTTLSTDTMRGWSDIPPRLEFINDSTGFVIGVDSSDLSHVYLMSTKNSGLSWQKLFTSTSAIADFRINQNNNQTSYVIRLLKSNGEFWKSVDQGASWTQEGSLPVGSYSCLRFKNETEGYAGSTTGDLYKTVNGGQTWTKDFSTDGETITSIYTFSNHVYFSTTKDLNQYNESNSIYCPKQQLQESLHLSDMLIFPNPTSDLITIQLPDNIKSTSAAPRSKLSLSDMWGCILLQYDYTGLMMSLDLGVYPAATYVIKVETESGEVFRSKVLKLNPK